MGYNTFMRRQRDFNGSRLFALTLFSVLITLPYLAAYLMQGSEFLFSGFLLNPIDGNSYLAKMYQGWQGATTFQLPYTAQTNDPVFLFVFYLFLGHTARILHLPLILTFHLARLLGAAFLAWVLYRCCARRFREPGLDSQIIFLLLIGLGAGWLVLPFGLIASDFWVAEAYPFLSSYVNPHFPIGLAIISLLVFQDPEDLDTRRALFILLLALVLALLVPFGSVIVCGVLIIEIILEYKTQRKLSQLSNRMWRLLLIGAISAPILLYDLWVVYRDPVLAGWNAQNLTPSPPLWDLLIAFSPALFLAVPALLILRGEQERVVRMAGIWLIMGVVLMYLPFGLQRRMISGLFIPIGILAMYWVVSRVNPARMKRNANVLIAASMPGIIVVLLLAATGIMQKAPELYLWRAEAQAFAWIEAQTSQNSLVLAGPDTGLFIPAHTGRRVLYGHPFETVNAEAQRAQVERILRDLSAGSTSALPEEVDYIFWGPREAAEYHQEAPPLPFEVAYQNEKVMIFSTIEDQ